MMRELKLYDPTRKPSSWTDLIHPGQYAVFHTDVQSDIEKKADGHFPGPGEESTCLIFDSLAETEAYAEARVEQVSSLRCDIYDHAGKSKPPMLTYVNKAYLKSPRKHAYWGWILVASSLPCFWIEWHWNGTLVVPMIVGLNLIFGGLRLVYWGTKGVEKRRSTREH
ncbi:MAG TPA: hypothetical protein VJ723_05130 [Candidatus Angelobacter sp.]|nr:hypothetical protein [Candidatus Angelobacter sp.]